VFNLSGEAIENCAADHYPDDRQTGAAGRRTVHSAPDKEGPMQVMNETIRLLRRQADLEAAMRRFGGIRITEEQELMLLRCRLAETPEAQAVMQAAHAMRRPLTALTASEVEIWANSAPHSTLR
jgi:hypothetical protein